MAVFYGNELVSKFQYRYGNAGPRVEWVRTCWTFWNPIWNYELWVRIHYCGLTRFYLEKSFLGVPTSEFSIQILEQLSCRSCAGWWWISNCDLGILRNQASRIFEQISLLVGVPFELVFWEVSCLFMIWLNDYISDSSYSKRPASAFGQSFILHLKTSEWLVPVNILCKQIRPLFYI